MVPGAGAMASESGGVRSPRCPPCRDGSAPRAARPARKIRKVPETIKAQVQDVVLTWAFASERVTGIEPALSAWEADVLPLNYTRVYLHLPRAIVAAPACAVFAQTSYRTR